MERVKRSLKVIVVESVITKISLSAPIIIFLWKDIIGMTQAEVGLSQAYFTIALLALNLPMGWLADRFSRKWANVVGDLVAASGFLFYAFAQNFGQVVICEIILGVAMAMSGGADNGMIKNYMTILGREPSAFQKLFARRSTWTFVICAFGDCLSGPLGQAIGYRVVIAANALPYLIGGIMSLTLVDAGEKIQQVHKNPFRDMARVAKFCLTSSRRLKWSIIAHTLGKEVTHAILWSLTLIFVAAGLPLWLVTLSWVFKSITETLGSLVAEKVVNKGKLVFWQKFLLPMVIAFVGLAAIGAQVNLVTVWLYGCLGFCRGWVAATLLSEVMNQAPDEVQSSLESLCGSICQAVYIPLSIVVNLVGDFDIRYSFLLTLAIFIVPTIVTAFKLKKLERE